MNFRLAMVALLLALLATGCREGFLIHVSQQPGGPPIMRFESLGVFGEGTVEIRQLSVSHVVAQGKPFESVWEIRTKTGIPQRVKEISYGVVPLGFDELLVARPLSVGELYDILASRPGSIGGIRFTRE